MVQTTQALCSTKAHIVLAERASSSRLSRWTPAQPDKAAKVVRPTGWRPHMEEETWCLIFAAFAPCLQGRQGTQEFEAPAVEPWRGRTGQRIAVHPPDEDAGHITQAASAGNAPSLRLKRVSSCLMSTNVQVQPSCRSTSLTDRPLLAGTQFHEQEEEYYEEQAGKESYAEEEWRTQEEGPSEEEPVPVWEPVGPDEREVSPSRAELRQERCHPNARACLCAGLDRAYMSAV